MPLIFIPFDGWAPGDSYFGEGWRVVTNLFPFFDSWRPWRKFVPFANTVASGGPLTGAYAHPWSTGFGSGSYLPDAATLFAGSEFRLYTIDPADGAFTNVSRAAEYGAGALEPAGWRFASVGNDVWATNGLEAVQRRVNNAGLFTDGVTSAFTPQPRFLAVIREHLVGANLSNAGRRQDEIVWSDADNATNFDPPSGTSTSVAGSKPLVSIPGQITGLVGGQYGIAFKRRGIFYLEATGSTQVFRADVLSASVGTAHPSSIINSRHGLFFLGSDGFYKIAGLSEPQKIAPLAVDESLINSNFATLTTLSQLASFEDTMIVGFQLPRIPLVGWIFRRSHFLAGNNEVLFHNPVTGAWSYGTLSDPLVSTIVARPYGTTVFDTLAGLTWDGSFARYAPLAETVAGNIATPTLQLRFRPANFEDAPHQQQTVITGVLPVFSKTAINAAALTESITVETLLDPHNDVWKTSAARPASERDTISGMFPFETAGRFFRITINCAAEDFASFEGVYIEQRLLT